jgi:UDP-N-acetylglucosamine--N-acetylmuramyl-(pentapeptide) pyrophosphoryl-undecaprenol N-acetylglucosamine transferase
LPAILYAVSPIGLGHASRAAAVGLRLRERGLEPVFATGGNASEFLSSYGFAVRSIVTEPTPTERDGEMKYPALWYIRYWFGYRSTKSRMESLIEQLHPDLIVGDEEFSSISIAVKKGIPHAMISDELELGFARSRFSRYIEKKVEAWYETLQRQTSIILVPDSGEDRENIRFVGPVVRTVTRDRGAITNHLRVAPDSKLILLSASGSGIGRFLIGRSVSALGRSDLKGTVLLVSGLAGQDSEQGVRYLGIERDNQDLVAAADLVISTAGKSTIDEALSYGSPIIAIPIRNHSEQERNARALGFRPEDLERLDVLIPKYIGRRTEPRFFGGADHIATYLEGVVKGGKQERSR